MLVKVEWSEPRQEGPHYWHDVYIKIQARRSLTNSMENSLFREAYISPPDSPDIPVC